MNRRTFLATAATGPAGVLPLAAQNYSDYTKDPRPDVPEGTWTAGGADGPVFKGSPVVSGPAADAIAILQPVQRLDTGEDKPDDSPFLSGMGAFQKMQRQQAEWLKTIVQAPWFRDAPHKVVFCHIPLWFKHPKDPNNSFAGTKYCRDLWAPTLVQAGVKLIVSGHTHEAAWMPAHDGQPIAQLVGGAPTPRGATLIQANATRDTLTLKVAKLDGSVIADVAISA